MGYPGDIQSMSAGVLLQLFEQASSEKALLVFSDAPDDELKSVQRSIDLLTEEISRRMSW
jgi:hypothetical protein